MPVMPVMPAGSATLSRVWFLSLTWFEKNNCELVLIPCHVYKKLTGHSDEYDESRRVNGLSSIKVEPYWPIISHMNIVTPWIFISQVDHKRWWDKLLVLGSRSNESCRSTAREANHESLLGWWWRHGMLWDAMGYQPSNPKGSHAKSAPWRQLGYRVPTASSHRLSPRFVSAIRCSHPSLQSWHMARSFPHRLKNSCVLKSAQAWQIPESHVQMYTSFS